MKGKIKPDHIPINKFKLLVLGMPEFVFTTIAGLEDELQTADLPDRTVASGGNRGTQEFTAMLPMHHTLEQAAMEAWFVEAQDPVSPTYKKVATLICYSGSGNILRTYSLIGMFPTKRVVPDLDMANEGEMAAVEWTFKADDMLPI